MEVFLHKACSVSPGSWASGISFSAFLPHQEPPIHNCRSPLHTGTPYTSARSKPRPGNAQVQPRRGHQGSSSKKGSWGGHNGPACSIGAVAAGQDPVLGGISRMDSGHVRGGSRRGSSHCVEAWGAPSLPAWCSLVLSAHPGVWPVCSGLLGCVVSALTTVRLRPGLSC